ncbi:protein neprosin-like [Malania oleifera]|uniref:protein neprosin-like n=1 Tax=Malania oleifera TaxID=397392 RepID=UPI0025AE93FC|nr:protein neprosin-like [Malania oleifera]
MANAYLRFLLVAFAIILNNSCVQGGRNLARKGTIKTIQSKDGDIIDCVDIYKQPAFDHPLLKNHKIQVFSSPQRFIPSQWNQEKQESVVRQTWHESGECPEGTIPIRRSTTSTPVRRSTSSLASTPFPYSIQPNFSFRGEPYEVDPKRYGDKKTRLFIYWTTTSYRQGCFDLECPGFVQLSSKYALGSDIYPLSSYDGPQYDTTVHIEQDLQTGSWHLFFQGSALGYWPGSLVPAMKNGAAGVQWGGQVTNLRSGDRHTTTQMGSGHFARAGFQKASFVRLLQVIIDGEARDPENIDTQVSNVFCYDLHVAIRDSDYGFHFFYGGPGLQSHCNNNFRIDSLHSQLDLDDRIVIPRSI